jgi:hypothetical protein
LTGRWHGAIGFARDREGIGIAEDYVLVIAEAGIAVDVERGSGLATPIPGIAAYDEAAGRGGIGSCD